MLKVDFRFWIIEADSYFAFVYAKMDLIKDIFKKKWVYDSKVKFYNETHFLSYTDCNVTPAWYGREVPSFLETLQSTFNDGW